MKLFATLTILLLSNIVYASDNSEPYVPSDASSDSSTCSNHSPRSIASFTKREETYLQYQELFNGITNLEIREDIITQLMRLRNTNISPETFKNAMKEFIDLESQCFVNNDTHIANPAKDSKSHRTLMLITSLVNFFIKRHKGEIQRPYPFSDVYEKLEDDIRNGLVRTFFIARACDLLKSVSKNDFLLPALRLNYVTDEAREALIFGYSTKKSKLPPIPGVR